MESLQELARANTNVVVVDAHPIWREGIRSAISSDKDIEVILESDKETEVRRAIASGAVDLVILDLDIPGGNGLEMLRQIKSLNSDVPVLILTSLAEELYGVEALKEGAAGYLTKGCTPEELLSAVGKIRDGKKYISEQLAQRLAGYVESGGKALPHERLTMREFQVMLMLGQGMSANEVSDKLSLSYSTVATHKHRILSKMGLESVAQIVRYVSTEGLAK